jgi:hypothetical protein
MWSITNADFFTGKRVTPHNGPANMNAVFGRTVVASFGVLLVDGNANDLLLFVVNRLTRRILCKNPTWHQGKCDEEKRFKEFHNYSQFEGLK